MTTRIPCVASSASEDGDAIQLFYDEASTDRGELVFYNGTIVTMDDGLPEAEAVLVRDGMIAAVGGDEEILALSSDDASFIDLYGKTLLPGFIDTHSHWLNDHDSYGTMEESIELAVRQGWTTITEMFTTPELIREIGQIAERGGVKSRVNLYLRLSWHYQRWTDWYREYSPGQMLSPRVRVVGVKMFADGDYASGTAAMNEPWVNAVDGRGSLYFSQDELNGLVERLDEEGYPIAIHAIGDRAVDQVLDAYEHVLQNGAPNRLRHRVEHIMFLTDDQIRRIAEDGIVASFQFQWAGSDWYQYYEGYFGSERMKRLSRWRDLLDSGAACVANTDFPNCFSFNTAMQGISVSVTRVGPEWGSPVQDLIAKQRITVEEALRLITIDAAYATFQERMTGSITPGKYADVVVLTENPLTVDPGDLLKIKVWMTVVGGRIEYLRDGSETSTLGIEAIGGGSTSPPPGEYDLPRQYTIRVEPEVMYWANVSCAFDHWILDGKRYNGTDIVIPMGENHNLTAVFKDPSKRVGETYTPPQNATEAKSISAETGPLYNNFIFQMTFVAVIVILASTLLLKKHLFNRPI